MDNQQYFNPYDTTSVSAPESGQKVYGESLPTIVMLSCTVELVALVLYLFSIILFLRSFIDTGDALVTQSIPTLIGLVVSFLMIAIGGPIVIGILRKQSWTLKYAWTYIVITLISYPIGLWQLYDLLMQDNDASVLVISLIPLVVVFFFRIALLVLFISSLKTFKDYLISKSLSQSAS